MPSPAPKISIIIRIRNEEKWISSCLKAVFLQTHKNIELIVVDNYSDDHSLYLAEKFPVNVIKIKDYFPGKAISMGIEASSGEYIVCLSAHCIPKNEYWLSNMLRNFLTGESKIAGVYGRQIPLKYSSDTDKRDLLITFGLDRRIQVKDTFFHNGNSMFPRYVCKEIPFDETVTNIEDRIWAQEVIKAGYKLIYEPEAVVFHHHGIHQNNYETRRRQTVHIMESIHIEATSEIPYNLKPENANIVAFIPIIGDMKFINGINLFLRTIEQIRECTYVKDIVAVSEKDSNLKFARENGIKGIKRDLDLLEKESTLENTLNYSLREYEKENDIVDAIIFINYLFPFRPEDFLSNLIENYAYTGSDNTIAALKDYRIYWVNEGKEYRAVGNNFKQRSEKTPIFQGLFGLGSIISANLVRKGILLGENIDLLDVMDTKCRLKVSDSNSEEIAGFLLEQERKKKQEG